MQNGQLKNVQQVQNVQLQKELTVQKRNIETNYESYVNSVDLKIMRTCHQNDTLSFEVRLSNFTTCI